MEIGTALEWAESMREKFGMAVKNVRRPEKDPPDCIGDIDDHTISIELTELLHPHAQRGRPGTVSPETPLEAVLWSTGDFIKGIESRLDDKQENYGAKQFTVDVLIIHTDEGWLSVDLIEDTLTRWAPEARENIKSAYLLKTYVPGRGEHWPVFRLY
jgi:hypothetical protein